MLKPQQIAQLRRSKLSGRNRLTKAIELAGITQVEVAEGIKTTQPHVSSIALGRYGRNGLPLETTRRIALFFGCAIEDVFPEDKTSQAEA